MCACIYAHRLIVLALVASLASVRTTSAENCETVESIIHSAFFLYINEQVRGSSEQYLKGVFEASLKRLVEVVRDRPSTVNNFALACLSQAERDTVVSQVNTEPTKVWVPELREFESIPILNSSPVEVETPYQGMAPDSEPDEPTSDAYGMLGIQRASSTLENIHTLKLTAPANAEETSQLESLTHGGTVPNMSVIRTRREHKYASQSRLPVTTRTTEYESITKTFSNRNIFYIPPSNMSVALKDHFDKICLREDIIAMWEKIKTSLNHPVDDIKFSEIAQLPSTIDVFYDPREEVVKDRFQKQSSTQPQLVRASEVLYNVTALVLSMHSAGVHTNQTLQILKHSCAYFFNAMRTLRVEGEALVVEPRFMAFYFQQYRNLTASGTHGKPVVFHPNDVRTVYSGLLEPLLKFSSSAQMDHMVTGSLDYWILYLDFESKLFSPLLRMVLSCLHTQRSFELSSASLARFYQSKRRLVGRFVRKLARLPRLDNVSEAQQDPNSHYATGCVNVPGFVLYSNPAYTFDDQHCCAMPCQDIEQSQGGSVPMATCCMHCNLHECDQQGIPWLEEIVDIMIEDYGWYPLQPVRIDV